MGMFSVVLIDHDGLDAIENDPDFGKVLVKAIGRKDLRPKGIPMPVSVSNSCSTPVEIITDKFHLNDPQVIVIEKGTGWVANGLGKPIWSTLTREMLDRRLAGINHKS